VTGSGCSGRWQERARWRPQRWAEGTGTNEHYVREWFNAQAAGDRRGPTAPAGPGVLGLFDTAVHTCSLSQDVGRALRARAGQARHRDIVTIVGFREPRGVAATSFNVFYQARL
jgi:hypothetical protein